MRRRVAALIAGLWFGAGAGPPAAQDAGDYGGLPAGEGRAVVFGVCDGCHSIRLVKQQGMSRERWDETLEWMVEQQGMPEFDPETRTTVLDYLAEHYGAEDRAPRAPSPFNRAQPLEPR